MNKEVKEFKASHFDNMKELLDTIKVWLENEEDYGTLYDDFNRYFDSGAMEEMYYYIKQLEAKTNQLETNWNYLKNWLKANDIHYAEAIPFRETLNKMQELERGKE